MGANFYLTRNVCSCCGRGDAPLHIGKSSGGWCFALRVYPEGEYDKPCVETLADWVSLWSEPNTRIRDEYGATISPVEMLATITERGRKRKGEVPIGYATRADFDRINHSLPGPNGLSRHQLIPGHCIGHGDGTYDFLVGDYS